MSLIIDVSEPRNTPGELFTYHRTHTPEPGDADPEARLLEPAAVEVRVAYLNRVFVVDVGVRMRFELPCARCLKPFVYQTEITFSEQYDTPEAGSGKTDRNVIEDDRIDLTEKVRDTVIGAPPMKALCREDCPGLCVYCGSSLAEGPCGCKVEEIDPRMAGLARLLEKHKKKGVE